MATRTKSSPKSSNRTAAERELRFGPGPTRSELLATGKKLRETLSAYLPRRVEAAGRPP